MIRTLCIAVITIIAFASCSDDQPNTYKEQMRDSVFKAYSTVASITIEINPDHNKLEVTVGDPGLHNKSEAERQKFANEIGFMSMRIFENNYNFVDGKVMISTDTKSEHPDPATIVTSPINFDSLRKTLPPK